MKNCVRGLPGLIAIFVISLLGIIFHRFPDTAPRFLKFSVEQTAKSFEAFGAERSVLESHHPVQNSLNKVLTKEFMGFPLPET